MESKETDRRRFLELCGAGMALATAGCLGGPGDGGDSSSSPYADALVSEDGMVFASYTVWEPDSLTGDDGTGSGPIGGNITIGGGDGTIGGGDGTIGGGNGTIGGGNGTIGGGNGIIGGGNDTIGGGNGIIGGGDGEAAPRDPLLAPVLSPFLVGFAAGFGVGVTPLAPLLGVDSPLGGFSGPGGTGDGGEESPDPESFETEISALLLTVGTGGTALQIRGDIDTEEVDGLLQGSADDDTLLGYTRTGEQSGYTRYESEPPAVGNGEGGDADFDVDIDVEMDQTSVLAVGSDEILLGGADSIDRLTDDGAGSAVSEFDSLEWLLETAGDGEAGLTVHAPEGTIEDALDSVGNSSQGEDVGTVGPGPGPGLDNETMGVLEELDVTPLGLSGMARERDGGDTVDIDMGLVFESELESDPRETIRSTFGTGAEDTSFEFDGDRVAISGTFTSGESES